MSAGNVKPGNPGIQSPAAGNFSRTFADGAAQELPDGARTLSIDGTGGDVDMTLPRAEGYAGKDLTIAVRVASSGNTVTLLPASGNTIDSAASAAITADSLLQLVPFGTNWRVITSA